MPEATATLGQQFSVSSVPLEADVDFRLSIQKRRDRILYRSATGARNVNLAYAIGRPLTLEENILLVDNSRSIPENNPRLASIYEISTARVLTSTTDRVLITDILLAATPNRPETPLFWVHQLDRFSPITTPGATLLFIEIVDQDGSRVETDNQIDRANGLVYSNLENSYDTKTGEAKLYFASYSVRAAAAGATNSYIEILNNRPVFHPATFEDLNAEGILNPTGYGYVTEETGGDIFEFDMPRSARYAIKREAGAFIKVNRPQGVTVNHPWFLEISNGKFFTSLRTGPAVFGIYKYDVPEFGTQPFHPFLPYKLQTNERSLRVNRHTIKTLKDKVVFSVREGLHVQVIIKNKSGLPKRAYSTDLNVIGQIYQTDIRFTAGIRSLDQRAGFVDVIDPIIDTDLIETTYFFEEDKLGVTSFNFNPVHNRDVLARRYVFYLVPNTTGGRERTLYYLTVNNEGRVLSSSQTDDLSLNAAITAGTLFYDNQVVPLGDVVTIGQLSFVNRFTVATSVAPSNAFFLPASNPRHWVIAEVMVREASAEREVALFDIRIPGGGLVDNPTTIAEALRRQPEVQWYFDLGNHDGTPFPERASIFAEIPCHLLQDFGGRFSPASLREVLNKHLSLGSYPVVKAYGHDPRIASFTATTGAITIAWPSVPGVRWNVRGSQQENGTYELLNLAPLSDIPAGNIFTRSGLASNTEYWFYIVEVLANGLECASGPIGDTITFVATPKKLGARTMPWIPP